jgi:hypothetical protein
VAPPDAGPLPRLIASVARHLPSAGLLARGFDVVVADPLHHYMDTGLLKGVKKRAEGAVAHAGDGTAASAGEPRAAGRGPR